MAHDSATVPPSPVGELAALVPPRALVTAVEYMLQYEAERIDEKLWAEMYRISQHAKHLRTRIIAAKMFTDRFDPIPRAPAVQVDTGPISITWKSNSSTPPAPSRPSSMKPSASIALGPARSSATDALENL